MGEPTLCACGCGRTLPESATAGDRPRYVRGHHPQPELRERNREVVRRITAGESQRSVAQALGISRARVVQILRRERRRRERPR